MLTGGGEASQNKGRSPRWLLEGNDSVQVELRYLHVSRHGVQGDGIILKGGPNDRGF